MYITEWLMLVHPNRKNLSSKTKFHMQTSFHWHYYKNPGLYSITFMQLLFQ